MNFSERACMYSTTKRLVVYIYISPVTVRILKLRLDRLDMTFSGKSKQGNSIGKILKSVTLV
jgi:hypothetical protein